MLKAKLPPVSVIAAYFCRAADRVVRVCPGDDGKDLVLVDEIEFKEHLCASLALGSAEPVAQLHQAVFRVISTRTSSISEDAAKTAAA